MPPCSEDLSTPGGGLAVVSSHGKVEWFSKGYEPYTQGAVNDYYLNLTQRGASAAKADVLAVKLLSKDYKQITWELVESAVPPMLSAGVRTWVGSRGPSVDTTFGDSGEPANNYGLPTVAQYVVNLTAQAMGDPPIINFQKHINATHTADGLLGGHLPIAHFVIPISAASPYYPVSKTSSLVLHRALRCAVRCCSIGWRCDSVHIWPNACTCCAAWRPLVPPP